jgi:hypothetical protein
MTSETQILDDRCELKTEVFSEIAGPMFSPIHSEHTDESEILALLTLRATSASGGFSPPLRWGCCCELCHLRAPRAVSRAGVAALLASESGWKPGSSGVETGRRARTTTETALFVSTSRMACLEQRAADPIRGRGSHEIQRYRDPRWAMEFTAGRILQSMRRAVASLHSKAMFDSSFQ